MIFSVMARSLTGAISLIALDDGTVSIADLRLALVATLQLPIGPDSLQLWHNGAALDRFDRSMRAAGISSGDTVIYSLARPLPKPQRKPAIKRPRDLLFPNASSNSNFLSNGASRQSYKNSALRLRSRLEQRLPRSTLVDDSPQGIQRLLSFLARHRDSNLGDGREPLIFDIESEYISQLEKMGFSQQASSKALLMHRFDFEGALNWLLEHSNDPDVHLPLTEEQLRNLGSRDRSEDRDEYDDDDDSEDGSNEFC